MTAKNLKIISSDYEQQIWAKRKQSLVAFLKDKLIIATNSFIHILKPEDILYIKAYGNYSKLFCVNRNHPVTSSKTLKCYEDILIDKGFLRIHSNTIVNLSKITGIKRNGKLSIILDNDIELKISQTYRRALFSYMIKST